MTRAQRLRKIQSKIRLTKDCKQCHGTGWIRPGHMYGGCLCKFSDAVTMIRTRDLLWLIERAERGLNHG